jgi:septal ring factor EnvC (AmiA/AmiB activator)
VPPLVARATALRDQIARLAALRDEITQARRRQEEERVALGAEEARIGRLVARKAVLQQRAVAGARQSARREVQLAAQARDLRELIARLEAERKAREEEEARRRAEEERRAEAQRQARLAAPHGAREGHAIEVTAPPPLHLDATAPRTVRPFREAQGAMVFPASGTLVRRYGETDEVGVATKGMTIETRPGAQIVAPFDGRVEFAGRFQGYGQILIIAHGDGYHSLLAGLERVDDSVGQWLVAGEPVGVMPGGGERSRLYLELRHDGQPVDPLPWLTARDEKVSG